MLIEGNKGGEFRLVDVDERRLNLAEALIRKLIEDRNLPWTVVATTNRKEALSGSNYLINSIEVAGLECVRPDNDIPLEFGISQNIGDTIGPGGLFKAMRTVPTYLDILNDAEELCPEALVLNYTNPMSIMCLAAGRVSSMRTVGLCHSVQGTSRMLADYCDVPIEDVRWQCAGINHLAWFTEFSGPNGDLYPLLFEQALDRESKFSKAEPVRSDMMLNFGAFITESSGHLSEYLPYYRKRPDLLERYTDTGYRGEGSFYANNWPRWRSEQDATRERMISGEQPIEWKRSLEYGASIIEAIEKNAPCVIHGNVMNDGHILNLAQDGSVEVACLVDRNGIQPTHFGALPKHMAAICDSNMRMFDLAADACIFQDREMAVQALLLDPLSAAVCCPAEIREMTNRMFAAEAEFLPGF